MTNHVTARDMLSVRFRIPMTGRDTAEEHRGTTALELLFDLSFVVAVSGAAAGLHGSLAEGQVGIALAKYLMVFFAIWWAWMNFTWFASAYDTDDVLYRMLTLLQMAGALTLAAGVPAAFADEDFTVVTIGYSVMRVGMISLWLRCAIEHRDRRRTALLFAAGLAIVQTGWLLRLLLPQTAGLVGFFVLVVAEIAVPVIAENVGGRTSWHPGHIADRYGAFTVIALGEVILASTESIQAAAEAGLSADLLLVALGGLLLVFSLWWLYFKRSAEDALRARRIQPFLWGYGHYMVFAAVAAVGAGIAASAELHGAPSGAVRPASAVLTGAAAVYLVVLALMRFTERGAGAALVRTLVGVVALVVVGAIGLPPGATVLAAGLVCTALLAWHLAVASIATDA
jgi:low temperature requirement protein LtrA